MWSVFVFNWAFSGNSVGISGAFVLATFPFVSPGGDWILQIIVATLTGALIALNYGLFSVIMPRTGGDYVFIGRTLSPFLGFVGSFAWFFWLPITVAVASKFLTPIALQAIFSSWGAITGNQFFINLGNTLNEPNAIMIVGTISTILFCLIAIAPLKFYFRLQ